MLFVINADKQNLTQPFACLLTYLNYYFLY